MLIQKRILKLIVMVAVALPCYACAGQVADAAAVSVVNMATAIASYQVLRSMGAQPQIQGTPYGMVTTTTSTNSQSGNPGKHLVMTVKISRIRKSSLCNHKKTLFADLSAFYPKPVIKEGALHGFG